VRVKKGEAVSYAHCLFVRKLMSFGFKQSYHNCYFCCMGTIEGLDSAWLEALVMRRGEDATPGRYSRMPRAYIPV